MSHTITLFTFRAHEYIETCDDLIEQLNLEESNIKKHNINIDVKSTINKIEEIKSTLVKHNNARVDSYVFSSLSRLSKEVTNIKQIFNNELNKKALEILSKTSFKYDEKIKSYGSMFYDVVNYLNSKNLPIDDKHFNETLDKIREEEIEKHNREEFIKDVYYKIDSLEIPLKMKALLKTDIKKIKTSQEKSDVMPMLQSKIEEYKRFKSLVNNFNQQLKKVGFFLSSNTNIDISVDEYSNYVARYELKNANNNSIKMIINSEGQIKYKLGNYVGHMCNKTSEQLFELLRNEGYVINVVSVKRDIDNNKPLAFEKELGK